VSVNLTDYFFLAIAGMATGFVAIYFLKTFKWFSNYTAKTLRQVPNILKPAIGGFVVGILAFLLPTMWETTYNPINYVIAGRGAPIVKSSILAPVTYLFHNEWIILLWIIVAALTVLIKPISNALTLASGGAGGTLAPVLKVGAMFGFCFGSILQIIYPETHTGLYALVCSAALFSGTFQVPLTGGIVLFEISRNYELILPLIFASVFSSFIVQKSGVKTFNPLQSDIVDDEGKLHPALVDKRDKKS
jgi:chloride channel protein, CIC family